MERRVIFQDGMDNDPADYNNLQDFVQGSFDDVVADAVTADRKYAGFAAAATGTAELTVQAGRLYSGGKVYVQANPFVKDFTTSLPVSTKKIAMVVIWGQEVDTGSVPREFLINEETGQSEPRVVSMERDRVANINVSMGNEAPDPIAPILDSGVLAVAQVLLSPTGIVSVTMIGPNKLDSVSSVAERATSLEAFRSQTEPAVASLSSDLTALAKKSSGSIPQDFFGRTLARLAILEAKSGVPSTAADSAADMFLDSSLSDTAHVSYSSLVYEGARFANAAANDSQLAIFDTLNPAAKIVSGVMFPAFTDVPRFTIGMRTYETQVATYSYQTHSLVQKTMSRTRIRYGSKYVLSASAAYWSTGGANYAQQTFAKTGETLAVTGQNSVLNYQTNTNFSAFVSVRVPYYWYDTVQVPYWQEVTTNHSVNGTQIAETFLNPNDMWCSGVGLYFTKLAASGGFSLAICETQNGMPDLNNVISYTEVDRSAMVLSPKDNSGVDDKGETLVPVQPVFLKGGTRYAVVILTAADHWVAMSDGANAHLNGTFFYVLDGAYQQGDASRALCYRLHAAEFAQSRAVVAMQPLSLSGGIASLDILAPSIVPPSTSLIFEVQVGSVWTPISQAAASILDNGGSPPPLLPLRAVFTGTTAVMPALGLTGSNVRVARPNTTMAHVSTARTLPGSGSTQIRVITRLEHFDAAHHTATCALLSGAGFTTSTAPSSVVDATNSDGTIERTFVFNLGGALTTYKIRLNGTTDTALNTFQFAYRKDYAL